LSATRVAALAAVVAIALSACGNAGQHPAAVVNGAAITDDRLAVGIAGSRFLAALNRAPCGTAAVGESERSACARSALTRLIDERIVGEYADRKGVTVSDARVASVLRSLEQQLGKGRLTGMLSDSGLTRGQLDSLAQDLLLDQQVRFVVANDTLTDAELRSAYEQQKAQFTTLHAAHILVKTKAEADRIAAEVTDRNFGELAKRSSIDSVSAAKGGDLGTQPATSLDPTFVQAAMALRPGQISAPIQTQFGWHIIRLISVQVKPFDQVRSQLVQSMTQQAFGRWLLRQIREADVGVNPKYGRFDPRNGEVIPLQSTSTVLPAPPSPSSSP